LQLGDIRTLVVRYMGNHYPVAMQVCSGNFLDSGERFGFDRAELCKVHLGPRQDREIARNSSLRRRGGRSAGQGLFDELTYVILSNALLGASAANLGQVDTQFTSEF